MTHAEAQGSLQRPITSREEADLVIKHLGDMMDALLAVVEEETACVRAGRLGEAASLEKSKAQLSRLYNIDIARLKLSQSYLAQTIPTLLADLRKRHDVFRAVLQLNLTVLATAHAVAEGIMRGVSEELSRKAMPHGYGRTGRSAVPSAYSAQPLTVSRVL